MINQLGFVNSESLIVEDHEEEKVKYLGSSEVYETLKSSESNLNIEVVFILSKDGGQLAKAFDQLGVQHIFTFEGAKSSQDSMLNFEDYCFSFSLGMISNLIQEYSFYRAYSTTTKVIKESLGKDCLLTCEWHKGENENPGRKMFDHFSLDERMAIEDGVVEDQSSQRGLTNIK